jgi:polysaccharide biosynthesis/export protein
MRTIVGWWAIALVAGLLWGAAALSAEPPPYAVGPGDVLDITIYAGGEKQDQITSTVAEDGAITMPLIGEVAVGGMTVPETAEKLRLALARGYYRDPQVIVTVKEYGGQIYVLGEVKHPGIYPFHDGLTILSACALAGGFSDFAAPQRARVTRVVGGKPTPISINLIQVKQGRGEDMRLLSGDRIELPRRRF